MINLHSILFKVKPALDQRQDQIPNSINLSYNGRCLDADTINSFHRNRLGQIPWFVHIRALLQRRVIRQKL